jgi:hypothetical protein
VPIPGFYVWEVPGKSVSIQLSLDVVDRLQQDVMRGFGAVPRRGAEVGGILLGAAASAGPVRVEDYELVPIEYKRGPSYRLSPDDLQAFEAALRQSRGGKILSPIGYFRSHTRAGVGLCDEDLELLSNLFPRPETIALLIRPFGTKPSVAGFYFKEAGAFQSGAPLLEFPFRRSDLAPGEASVPRPRREHSRTDTSAAREIVRTEAPQTSVDTAPSATARSPRNWPVLPTILLLVGMLLGYQAALTIRPRPPAPYYLALSVTQSGGELQLKWDRQSPAIRVAQKGTLAIEDGAYNKAINLTQANLQSGSTVPYRPQTKHVRFRLDVFPTLRNSVSETIDWVFLANRTTE